MSKRISPEKLVESLKASNPDFFVEAHNKTMIRFPGLVAAAYLLDPRWTVDDMTLEYFDAADKTAIVCCRLTVNGARHSNFGEAAPDNCGKMVAKYPVSMASTRAVARALKTATGITLLCSDEIGGDALNTLPMNNALSAGANGAPPAPLPRNNSTQNATPADGAPPNCEACGGPMWDNRKTKTGRQPDFKCRDRQCGKAVWLTPKPGAKKPAPLSPSPIEQDPEIPF